MMKKILAILLLLSVVFSLASCNKDKKVCDELNELAEKNYSCIKVEVDTETYGTTLNSYYEVTDTYVSYRIEQLNTLSPDSSDWGNISPDAKNVISGMAEVSQGEIYIVDGERVNIPPYDELRGKFNFDKDNLVIADSSEDGVFRADVLSPSEFLETNLSEIGEMRVVVNYNDKSLESITLTYVTSFSKVTTVYTFTE